MENWIYASLPILIKVLVSLLAIFTIIIIITRISGLRTFAKMSSFDFASTIAIGSILATVVMNDGQSIIKGMVALAGIVAFQSIFTLVVRRSKKLRNLFTNNPILLMHSGKILYENLEKTNVGEDDLIAKLREANVIDFDEVLAVVLESTGDMSVLHHSGDKKLMQKLLQGVKDVPQDSAKIADN
ncbi:MAG: YetF domain-containing protein [Leeuwenhoekiella sp.]